MVVISGLKQSASHPPFQMCICTWVCPPCWNFCLQDRVTCHPGALWKMNWGVASSSPTVHFSKLPVGLLWNWLFVLAPPLGTGQLIWLKRLFLIWGRNLRSFLPASVDVYTAGPQICVSRRLCKYGRWWWHSKSSSSPHSLSEPCWNVLEGLKGCYW